MNVELVKEVKNSWAGFNLTVNTGDFGLQYQFSLIHNLDDRYGLMENENPPPLELELGTWDGCGFRWNVDKYNKFLEALLTGTGKAEFSHNNTDGSLAFIVENGKLHVTSEYMGNGITNLTLPGSSSEYYSAFAKLPTLIDEALTAIDAYFEKISRDVELGDNVSP